MEAAAAGSVEGSSLLEEALAALREAVAELTARESDLGKLHESLLYERARCDALYEWLPDAYLETDEMGVVLDANTATQALFGRRLRYLVGKPLPALVTAETRRALRAGMRDVRLDGKTRQFDIDVWTADERHVSLVADLSLDARGPGPARLRWLLRDVSTERQTEFELRLLNEELERRVAERTAERGEARAHLSAVLDHIPLAVAMTDRDARIVATNPAAADMLGRPSTETRNRPFTDIPAYRPDGSRYPRDDRPITRSLRDGEVVVGERLELELRDDIRVSVEVNTAPVVDDDGTIVGGVVVFRDVTDAERRDRAMQEFVVNAAHEMRTPVASISASLDVLESGAKDEPLERERFLGHLRDGTDRLTALTQALLLLARVDGGQERAPVDVVPLRPLLTDLAAEVHPASGVRLVVACDADLAAVTSASLLRQALAAVLDNAVHHTRDGSIELSASLIEGDSVALAIADSGPGMDPATLEAAATRFFRGPDGNGFGVGLSLAKRAVEAAGGRIELESEPGRGTTVRLTVPSGRVIA